MPERSGESPREDLDAVRETMSDRDERAEQEDEDILEDPSRNPDDENLDGLRGG